MTDHLNWLEEETHEGALDKDTSPISKLLLDGLYGGMTLLMNPVSTNGTHWNNRPWKFLLLTALCTAQTLSLLNPVTVTTSLARFMFGFFQHTRLDLLFGLYLSTGSWLIAVNVLLFLTPMLFIVASVRVHRNQRCPALLVKLIRGLSFILFELCMIPVVWTMLCLLSSAFSGYDVWDGAVQNPILQVHSVLSVPATCLWLIYGYLYLIGSTEVRHCMRLLNMNCKASSSVELLGQLCLLGKVSYAVLRSDSHPYYACMVIALLEGLLVVAYTISLPYYNDSSNQSKACCSLFAVIVSATCLLGNSDASVLISVFVGPLAAVLYLKKIYPWRIAQLKPPTPAEFADYSCQALERGLRAQLTSASSKKAVLAVLAGFFASSLKCRRKILIVWETNFCIYTLRSTRLARIKLSRQLQCEFDFEANFQISLCYKMLNQNDTETTEEMDFLNYNIKLQNARKEEIKLCERYFTIVDEIGRLEPSPSKIIETLNLLHSSINYMDNRYSQLLKKYSNQTEVLTLYTQFLDRILRYEEKSRLMIQKYNGMSHLAASAESSYFHSESGVIIFSGATEAPGVISFCNNFFCELLRISPELVVGANIEDFLPYPLNNRFLDSIREFVMLSSSNKLPLPSAMFLVDQCGMATEVNFQTCCIAIDSSPFFLTSITESKKQRDTIILSDDMRVLYLTDGVSKELGKSEEELYGVHIREVLPDLRMNRLRDGYSFYSGYYDSLSFVFHFKAFMGSTFRYVLLYNNDHAMCAFDMNFGFGAPADQETFDISSLPEKEDSEKFTSGMSFRKKTQTCLNCESTYVKRFHTAPQESLMEDTIQSSSQIVKIDPQVIAVNRLTLHTLRLIKAFKWIIITQICLFVLIEVGQVTYAFVQSDFQSALAAINAIGDAEHSLILLGESTRRLHLTTSGLEGIDPQQEITKIASALTVLESFEDLRTTTLHEFADSPVVHSLFNEQIPVRESSADLHSDFNNIENIVIKLVQQGNELLAQLDEAQFEFLIVNSIGPTFSHMRKLRNELSVCIEQHLLMYEYRTLLLIGVETSLLLALYTAGLVIILKVNKLNENFWKRITRVVRTNMGRLKALFEDLIENFSERVSEYPRKGHRPIKLRVTGGVLKPLVIPLVCLVTSVVRYYLLLEPLVTTLEHHVSLLQGATTSEIDLINLGFWTRESVLHNTEFAFENEFEQYFFKPCPEKVREVQTDLHSIQSYLVKELPSAPTQVQDLFISDDPSEGIYYLVNMQLQDSAFRVATLTIDATGGLPVGIALYSELEEVSEDIVATEASNYRLCILLSAISLVLLGIVVTYLVVVPMTKNECTQLTQRNMFFFMVK